MSRKRSPRLQHNPLAVAQPTTVLPESNNAPGGDGMLVLIERIVRDPAIDTNKLQQLLDMRKAILKGEAKAAFARDFALMQAELPEIEERGVIKLKGGAPQSTYALWEDVNRAIKPVMKQYGFGLSFGVTTDLAANIVTIRAKLMHRQGHVDKTVASFPADMSQNKNVVQSLGSSISYGKRYCANALLNLVSRELEKDNDGADTRTIDALEALSIERRIVAMGRDPVKFAQKMFKVDDISDIPLVKVQAAINLVADYEKKDEVLKAKAAEAAAAASTEAAPEEAVS